MQNIHKAHKEFYKALLLVRRGVYDAASRSASPGVCNLDCISLRGTELYPIEESSLLYHMSSLILIQQKCDAVRYISIHLSVFLLVDVGPSICSILF